MPHATHDSSSDPADPVSALLTKVLEEPVTTQPGTLEALCAQHPDCAVALRRAYGSLRDLELVEVAHLGTGREAPPGPAPSGLPRLLGPFRLLEFLGAGGMGAVYRAEDRELQRPVALKLIRGELLASDRAHTRFQRESAALARLDHPGLCTVYRAGATDGQPWIAMRLVRGTTLARRLDELRWARAERSGSGKSSSQTREELQRTLSVFEKVARALATAHAAGVVHRDIKPANIVLTADDEPVVIDFGLVHLADSETNLTLSGDHIGTPAYMAPEQVAARGREVTPATDVYALGATLFETLTLTSPYEASSREELFVAIVRGERRRLRQARRGLPADLEIVLEKALDLDPARRYPGMLAFADDLRRLRQHEPPAARRLGLPLRVFRWCQRNPVAATFLALLSAGLAVALALDASRQAARRRSLAMAYGNLAGQVLEKNPEHALELALRGVDQAPDDPETLGMLLGALQDVHARQDWRLPWPAEPTVTVTRIVPSPRGDAAVILATYAAGKFAPPVLWHSSGCRMLPIANGTMDAYWSVDGRQFLTTVPYEPPRLWTATGEPLPLAWPPPGAPPQVRCTRARFLPGGDHVVFACGDGKARILCRSTDAWTDLLPSLCAKERGMAGLALSADGRRLALGDFDGRVVVHDVTDAIAGRPGRVLTTDAIRVNDLDLGATGALLQITAMNPERCELWTWEGRRLRSWGLLGAPATAAPLDPVADGVLEVARGYMPRLWRFVDGALEFRHELCEHDGQINGFAHGPGGRILSVGVDGTARVAAAATGATEVRLRGFTHELQAGAFLGSDHVLVVTTGDVHRIDLAAVVGTRLPVGLFADRTVQFGGPEWHDAVITADVVQTLSLHDLAAHTVRRVVEPQFLRRSGLQVSADGTWLASTSHHRERKTIANVYGPGLELMQTIPDLGMNRPEPVFGPQHQLLLVDTAAADTGTCTLHLPTTAGNWQPAPDDVQRQFASACSGTIAVAFHAATSTLAVARDHAGVTLFHWQASPPALQRGPTLIPKLSARLIAFAPDGDRLLLSCKDRVVRMVDRANNVSLELSGHLGIVESLEFSPRGDRLLLAATDSGITVHDLRGRRLLSIQPQGTTTVARFLPAGDRILYADTTRTTLIVPIDREAIVGIARTVPIPPMPVNQDSHYRARAGDDRAR